MQNKARLELADYEAENLARLQKMFSRKWEFIFMQAEAQSRVDKKRDKLERKVLDSQERAFWDVHRPVVCCWLACRLLLLIATPKPSPACVLSRLYLFHVFQTAQHSAVCTLGSSIRARIRGEIHFRLL
jgi:hypothetical protein